MAKWISCKTKLPNENEMAYDGISREGQREISDRVLAIDANGFARTGYFMGSCRPHEGSQKRWEFGEHYNNDPKNWIVGTSWEPIAWMKIPNKNAD